VSGGARTPAGLAPAVVEIARAAAAAIQGCLARGPNVRTKADRSPVTDADEAANALICARLAALTPDIPIVAEESVGEGEAAPAGGRFWLVDPLDGTREFIAGRDEYTVNIALIEDSHPVLGVVGLPARDEVYVGIAGDGAEHRRGDGPATPIHARPVPATDAVAVASRSHGSARTDAWLAEAGVGRIARAGSAAKFCLIAEGRADLYPRFGRTMEWDTAAGHAVLAAAGGKVRTLDGKELAYGKPGFANPDFIARGA
jgi:3'(2'), 5'-bisphosphate nucleotidase